jgi:anti-sigma B factor antagonist
MTSEETVTSPDAVAEGALNLSASGNPPFHISVSQMEDRCLMVLSGELDVSTAPLFRDYLVNVTGDLVTDLVLDIGLLTFIDSTGLSLLISEDKRRSARGSSLTIFSPTPMARRLFDISGLTSVLSIVPANRLD